ncbi:MAG: hypothetical protein ACPGPF_02265 [Pontibacterium sp.]
MKIVIINSVGFWSMGWATDPESQQDVVNALKRLGVAVGVEEVASKAQLEQLLLTLQTDSDCLVWPNAYQVAAFEGSEESVWLADVVAEHQIPMIGNSAQTLKSVMLKDECQRILQRHGVAVPSFCAIEQGQLGQLTQHIEEHSLTFPLFVKPNALSTSKGITQKSVVYNAQELADQVVKASNEFGFPVMVEEYLPGQDITVAVFMTPDAPQILATYYDTEIYDTPNAVLDYDIRQRDWNDGKWLRVVSDRAMLDQIAAVVIPACEALNVTEFTRIDCRLDRHGRLKAFDVNGLPGLELPFSTTVWQMIVKLSHKPQLEAFDTLLSLIMYCAGHRHGVRVPAPIYTLATDYIRDESCELLQTCQELA